MKAQLAERALQGGSRSRSRSGEGQVRVRKVRN